MIPLFAAAALGAVAWTPTEYALHRWGGHHPRFRKTALGREHTRHHAEGGYFSPTSSKAALAAALFCVAGPFAALAAGAPGLAFVGGFLACYFGYELWHRRLHTHPPRGAFGRAIRLHHFHHHFHDPGHNHGVTSRVWDRAFRTRVAAGPVRVPRKLAMRWLLADDGAVRPEFAADYALR